MKTVFWSLIVIFSISCAGPSSVAREKDADQGQPLEIRVMPGFQPSPPGIRDNKYVEGQVLVKFREGTGREAIENIRQEVRLEIIQTFSRPNLYLMKILDHRPVTTVLEELKQHTEVQYAEPNYIATTD